MNTEANGYYRTICRSCHGGCGVIAQVRDHKVVSLRGDAENPNNRGRLCPKGFAAIELLNHPDRLTTPLRRVGPKKSGAFEPIAWEQALSDICNRIATVRSQRGSESIVLCQGTDRNYQEWVFRFANALRTPNVLGPAHVCFYPRVMASVMTFGAFTFCDYEANPDWIVVWGSNKETCSSDGVIGFRFSAAVERGARLIVIDPHPTALSRKAAYWLRVKPGTDAALALGMLHIMLDEKLYDAEFVANHTYGFENLSARVAPFTPERVESITWIPQQLLLEATRAYARAKKSCIEIGSGIEQTVNSFNCLRAIILIIGLSGHLDAPGGNVIWEPMGVIGRRHLPLFEALPAEADRKRLGSRENKILSMSGWASPAAVWKAILAREPYPVEVMLVFGSNPLLCHANSLKVWSALNALDYLVVADLFLTPTARLADIVLPATSWLETDQLVEFNSFIAARQKLQRRSHCRSVEEILLSLAHRLNLEHFPWRTVEESIDYRIAPVNLKWRELVKTGYIANTLTYYKYRTQGFGTKNGKFNIVVDFLEQLGYKSLPIYVPQEEVSGDDLFLVTSRRSRYYFNSEMRQIKSLRSHFPDPIVEINPEAADRLGIQEGTWVDLIANGRTVSFRATLTPGLHPRVVSIIPLWWYPEVEGMRSWMKSNINLLTLDRTTNPEMATPTLRGIYARLRRSVGRNSFDPNSPGAAMG